MVRYIVLPSSPGVSAVIATNLPASAQTESGTKVGVPVPTGYVTIGGQTMRADSPVEEFRALGFSPSVATAIAQTPVGVTVDFDRGTITGQPQGGYSADFKKVFQANASASNASASNAPASQGQSQQNQTTLTQAEAARASTLYPSNFQAGQVVAKNAFGEFTQYVKTGDVRSLPEGGYQTSQGPVIPGYVLNLDRPFSPDSFTRAVARGEAERAQPTTQTFSLTRNSPERASELTSVASPVATHNRVYSSSADEFGLPFGELAKKQHISDWSRVGDTAWREYATSMEYGFFKDVPILREFGGGSAFILGAITESGRLAGERIQYSFVKGSPYLNTEQKISSIRGAGEVGAITGNILSAVASPIPYAVATVGDTRGSEPVKFAENVMFGAALGAGGKGLQALGQLAMVKTAGVPFLAQTTKLAVYAGGKAVPIALVSMGAWSAKEASELASQGRTIQASEATREFTRALPAFQIGEAIGKGSYEKLAFFTGLTTTRAIPTESVIPYAERYRTAESILKDTRVSATRVEVPYPSRGFAAPAIEKDISLIKTPYPAAAGPGLFAAPYPKDTAGLYGIFFVAKNQPSLSRPSSFLTPASVIVRDITGVPVPRVNVATQTSLLAGIEAGRVEPSLYQSYVASSIPGKGGIAPVIPPKTAAGYAQQERELFFKVGEGFRYPSERFAGFSSDPFQTPVLLTSYGKKEPVGIRANVALNLNLRKRLLQEAEDTARAKYEQLYRGAPKSAGAYGSHGKAHVENVLEYMRKDPRASEYRPEVLRAAAIVHDITKVADEDALSGLAPHARMSAELLRAGRLDFIPEVGKLSASEKLLVAEAVSVHTTAMPLSFATVYSAFRQKGGSFTGLIQGATTSNLGRLLATGDRLDLTRFGETVDTSRLFLPGAPGFVAGLERGKLGRTEARPASAKVELSPEVYSPYSKMLEQTKAPYAFTKGVDYNSAYSSAYPKSKYTVSYTPVADGYRAISYEKPYSGKYTASYTPVADGYKTNSYEKLQNYPMPRGYEYTLPYRTRAYESYASVYSAPTTYLTPYSPPLQTPYMRSLGFRRGGAASTPPVPVVFSRLDQPAGRPTPVKIKSYASRAGYVPSVLGIIGNVRGVAPKSLSGLEIRPVEMRLPKAQKGFKLR